MMHAHRYIEHQIKKFMNAIIQEKIEKLTNELEALQDRTDLEKKHGIEVDPAVHLKIYNLIVAIEELEKEGKWK